MNRYISAGLSVAVAPATLLAYGDWTHSPNTITVSEWALFNFGIPIGGVLVVAGLLTTVNKQIEAIHHPLYLKAKKILLRVLVEFVLWASGIFTVISTAAKKYIYPKAKNILLRILIECTLWAFCIAIADAVIPKTFRTSDTAVSLSTLTGATVIRVFLTSLKQELTAWRLAKIGMIALTNNHSAMMHVFASLFRLALSVGIPIGFGTILFGIDFLFLTKQSSGLSPVGVMIPGLLLIGLYVVLPTFIGALILRAIASGGTYLMISTTGLLSPVFLVFGFLLGVLIHGLQ